MHSFSAHYQELFPKIYSFIYYRVNDRQTAEDLTSQTFLKGLENFDHFDSKKASVKTWLYTIARNVLIDHFRKQKPITNIEDIEDSDELGVDDQVLKQLIQKEEFSHLKSAINALPKEVQKILLMRIWDELSYKEIAEITGKSEASLKMAFSRALSTLTQKI